jgi:hypothetical protein
MMQESDTKLKDFKDSEYDEDFDSGHVKTSILKISKVS